MDKYLVHNMISVEQNFQQDVRMINNIRFFFYTMLENLQISRSGIFFFSSNFWDTFGRTADNDYPTEPSGSDTKDLSTGRFRRFFLVEY